MDTTILQLIKKRFKTFLFLAIAIFFSIALLLIRIKITQTPYFRFLLWNLFLAAIPYVITTYLLSLKKTSPYKLIIPLCIWLAFLPNAPYIITDLMHIKISSSPLLWLDVLMISSFAINGLILFYLSLLDFKTVLQLHFNKTLVHIIIITVLFLTSFGMYLGRFLRYNSWEILSTPKFLLRDILEIITQPTLHYNAWLFTFCFGISLSIGYTLFKRISI